MAHLVETAVAEGESSLMIVQHENGEMDVESPNGVEHSAYVTVYGSAAFHTQINADGHFELNFGRAVDLALTPDAAEKVYVLLGEALPELRKLAETELVG
jgi:hypothetical protein